MQLKTKFRIRRAIILAFFEGPQRALLCVHGAIAFVGTCVLARYDWWAFGRGQARKTWDEMMVAMGWVPGEETR